MAEFYVSLSNYEIATQIAALINKYNKWYVMFSAQAILIGHARYFVEIESNRVVGCASCIQEFGTYTKLQHICVLPTHRRRGIAYKLTELAIANSNTEYVYMTIREDNIWSIRLAESLNFSCARKHWFRDHWTLTFGRRREYVGSKNATIM